MSREIFKGVASNAYIIQGTSMIKENNIGSNTNQLNCINWSYLIRGKEARTHIKQKTITDVLKPNVNPWTKPKTRGFSFISLIYSNHPVRSGSKSQIKALKSI